MRNQLGLSVIDEAGAARPYEQRVRVDERVVRFTVRSWNAAFFGVDQVESWVAAHEWQVDNVHDADATG